MSPHAPPPAIGNARVLAHADVEDIPYRKSGALYVGDDLVEKVPRLAIAVSLGEDLGTLLFHCDADWNVLGTSGASNLEETKQLAARNYPGVESRWVETGITHDEALQYYDQNCGAPRCSFCRRRAFETSAMIGTEGAAICRECVVEFFQELQRPGGDDGVV